jgi:2-polyprenyl-3-methyl-5-hydroxy-6-metoxy-1,4-benzoquinol methylase
MTQCLEEIMQIQAGGAPTLSEWDAAKQIIGEQRVTLGPQASRQWLDAPDHLAMVLARYRAAAALIGTAKSVLEIGCGEGIGAGVLRGHARRRYTGIDTDGAAVEIANAMHADHRRMTFLARSALDLPPIVSRYDAVVSLDVIEHIAAEQEARFMAGLVAFLGRDGVCVIGTPNAAFEHLASPQSRAGHINLYTHDRLHALMAWHFRVVQSFGMQDTSLHLGHPEARHYLLMCGIGPRGAA